MTLDPTVRALADAACRDLGLSPWLVLHRPRLHARIAAQDVLMAQVRNDAMRVQGKPARGRDGRFVRVHMDASPEGPVYLDGGAA